MPPMQLTRNTAQENGDSTQEDSNSDLIENGSEDLESINIGSGGGTTTGTDSNVLLDLLGGADDIMSITTTTTKTIQNTNNTTKTNTTSNNQDLLDLLGGIDLSSTTTSTVPPVSNSILSSFGLDNNNGNSIIPMSKSNYDNNVLNAMDDGGIFDNFNIINDLNQV